MKNIIKKNGYVEEFVSDSFFIRYFIDNRDSQDWEYHMEINYFTTPEQLFIDYYTYNQNGDIKTKEKYISGRYIPYGKFYTFDKNGNITDIKSYNEDLPFGIFELINFLAEQGIDYFFSSISKNLLEDENGNKRWRVSIKNVIDESKWEVDHTHARILEIDAQTGILLVDSIRYFK